MNNEKIILAKLKDGSANKQDVLMLKKMADEGNTNAALNFGICLFTGHLINEDKNEAFRYFEKVYSSGKIEELNELSLFYDEVCGPAYKNTSDLVIKKAIRNFCQLSYKDQLKFLNDSLQEI